MKNINHQNIKEKIEKLPICADGKTAVSELLKELGYEPPIDTPKFVPGSVWYPKSLKYITANNLFIIINSTNYRSFDWTDKIYPNGWPIDKLFSNMEFYAKNLTEAFNRLCKEKYEKS